MSIKEVEVASNMVLASFCLTYKGNWQDGALYGKRRTKFMQALMVALKVHAITYNLPTQHVVIEKNYCKVGQL